MQWESCFDKTHSFSVPPPVSPLERNLKFRLVKHISNLVVLNINVINIDCPLFFLSLQLIGNSASNVSIPLRTSLFGFCIFVWIASQLIKYNGTGKSILMCDTSKRQLLFSLAIESHKMIKKTRKINSISLPIS